MAIRGFFLHRVEKESSGKKIREFLQNLKKKKYRQLDEYFSIGSAKNNT